MPHICPRFSHPSSIFFIFLLPPLIGGPSQSSSAISLFGSVFQYLLGKTRGINMSDKTNIQEPPQCVLGLTVRFSLRECGSKKKKTTSKWRQPCWVSETQQQVDFNDSNCPAEINGSLISFILSLPKVCDEQAAPTVN